METKISAYEIDNFKASVNMFGVGVPTIGRSGGLTLLWDKDTSIMILSYNKNYIDANVQFSGSSHI